jgi:hypothetical protein
MIVKVILLCGSIALFIVFDRNLKLLEKGVKVSF